MLEKVYVNGVDKTSDVDFINNTLALNMVDNGFVVRALFCEECDARIGSTVYATLVDAVTAANATGDVTITVAKDLDFSRDVYSVYKWTSSYHPLEITANNVTIDLNGHTIYNMGNVALAFGHILAADGRISNGTIKNGTLNAGKTDNVTNSYVLAVAGVDGMSIKNVTTNGGINVYTGSKGVVIDGCNVNGTKYYTVCAQSGSDVVIKNQTFTKNTDPNVANKSMFWVAGAGTDTDMITPSNPTGAFDKSSITLQDGNYTVDFNNGGKFYLADPGCQKPIVQGGTYNFDPSEFIVEKDNYAAFANGDGTYTVRAITTFYTHFYQDWIWNDTEGDNPKTRVVVHCWDDNSQDTGDVDLVKTDAMSGKFVVPEGSTHFMVGRINTEASYYNWSTGEGFHNRSAVLTIAPDKADYNVNF